MTNTRIAGTAYDARHQDQVHELARIHTYATRIRSIARRAAAGHVVLPGSDDAELVPAPRPEHDGHRPTSPHATPSSIKIAS